MAQPGNFTPILLYGSSTPGNAPVAANLTNSAIGSEIAINVADKNLFFKDSGGAVNTVPIRQSSTSSNGWLSSTDWNTFNNKSNTNGTVTSVAALTLGTTGTDLSSTVANGTTTPVITLNVPTASATNRGALSAADWSTFNGKQAALVSGTNIKTVGGVSLLGSGDAGTIGIGYGGTGQTSFTANYIHYGSFSTSANLQFNGTVLSLNSTASTQSFSGSNLNIGIGTAFSAGQTDIYTTSTNPIGFGTAGSAAVRFFTNSTEAARIDPSQNFLVGVSSVASGVNQLVASNQILRTINVGTINGSSSATVQIKTNPGNTSQSGMDIYVTGFETTNSGSIYMKAQAIVHWSSGSINQYGIGSTSYNESLGNGDYRAYSGASLSISNSSNNVNLTITNSGSGAINLVVVTIQEHYS